MNKQVLLAALASLKRYPKNMADDLVALQNMADSLQEAPLQDAALQARVLEQIAAQRAILCPQPPPDAEIVFYNSGLRGCSPEEAFVWTWAGWVCWNYTAVHPLPERCFKTAKIKKTKKQLPPPELDDLLGD